jgi:HEAT repeat protein
MTLRVLQVLLCGCLAASTALCAAGPDEVRDLARRIQKEKDAVDPAVFARLGEIGGDAALAALEKGVRVCKEIPTLTAAYAALGAFANDPELGPRAMAFVGDEALESRAADRRRVAVEALAGFGEPALAQLRRVVEEHPDEQCRRRACDPLAPYLALRGDDAALRALLRNVQLGLHAAPRYLGLTDAQRARYQNRPHREAVRLALADGLSADTEADYVDYALGADTPRVGQLVVLRLLAERGGAGAEAALRTALRDDDESIVLFALDRLLVLGSTDGLEELLRPLLRVRDRGVQREAVLGLGRVFGADPEWLAEALRLSRSPQPGLRMGAAGALAGAGTHAALARLHELLEDDDWSVRVEALQRVAQARSKSSVPVLIGRLAREEGRLADDVHATLRVVTGLDHGTTAARWRAWWEGEGADFALPARDAAEAAERARAQRAKSGGTRAASFYGIPVASRQVCFVLDTSGSMAEPAAPREGMTVSASTGGPTRLDVAKKELSTVMRGLPDGIWFNLIFFNLDVISLEGKLAVLAKATRQKALRTIRAQQPFASTALYPALLLAFADPTVDTIYLLSDGAPTAGEITDIDEVRAEVARWNRARHVRIHGVSVGQDSTLLRWLCADTGGEYLRID